MNKNQNIKYLTSAQRELFEDLRNNKQYHIEKKSNEYRLKNGDRLLKVLNTVTVEKLIKLELIEPINVDKTKYKIE